MLKMKTVLSVLCVSLALLSACSSTQSRSVNRLAHIDTPRLGVNAYLWRATLETLEFMPSATIDPFGGVISKDWYANPEVPDERFKVDVYILDTALRADALKASVFKQVRSGYGWTDASIDADTARQIENAILGRARELYIASVEGR